MILMPFAASVRLETSTRGEALTTSARKSGPEDLWGLAERANGTGPRPASAGRLSRRTWSCCHTRTPSTSCASAGATRSPAPLIEATDPGDPEPKLSAAGADLRTDLPRYRVYRKREMAEEPTDGRGLWRDDFVAFLIGCSFSFEEALLAAGVPVRHVEAGTNVPMYRTSAPRTPAGAPSGPPVVSMRPIPARLVPLALTPRPASRRSTAPPFTSATPGP